MGFSNRYLSNQYFKEKDCKRTTLEKPHSKGNTKGHKNTFQNSHKNIHFLLIISPESITMFGKGNYAVMHLNSTHSFLTAVGCDSFLDRDIHFCLLATRFKCYLLLVSTELYVTIQCLSSMWSSPPLGILLKEFSDFRKLVSLVLSAKPFCYKKTLISTPPENNFLQDS